MSDSNYPDFQGIINNISRTLSIFADVLESARNWYERNADTISAYISAFADFGVWLCAVDKMKERQIIFTDYLSMEFANEVYNSEDVDATVKKYYFGNNCQQMDALIQRCAQSQYVLAYGSFFSEIIAAYQMGHYRLACTGLFSLIDGIFTDASSNNTTNFKARIDEITEKFGTKTKLSEIDKQLLCIYKCVNSFGDSIFSNSSLSKPEPDSLNRHWVLHGRTHRIYPQYDVLKALLWLDAIIILANAGEQLESKETE